MRIKQHDFENNNNNNNNNGNIFELRIKHANNDDAFEYGVGK
jgi:hypothetical protein